VLSLSHFLDLEVSLFCVYSMLLFRWFNQCVDCLLLVVYGEDMVFASLSLVWRGCSFCRK
jgi:hypothetical protein